MSWGKAWQSGLGRVSHVLFRSVSSRRGSLGAFWYVRVGFVTISHGKAVLVGHCMLGSCTVCLGLSGQSRFVSVRYGLLRCVRVCQSRFVMQRSCQLRKVLLGSRGVLWRVPLWNGAVLQSCLGSDSHCMYWHGSHGVEVEDRQVRSMQGRARCAMDWRGLFRQSRCVLLRFDKLGHARAR